MWCTLGLGSQPPLLWLPQCGPLPATWDPPAKQAIFWAPSFRRLQRSPAPLGDPPLKLRPEVADQALDRPGGGVAQRADGVALDLLGDVPERVDLVDLGIALDQPLHHPPHPARALAAGGALAAALMLVEIGDAGDRLHHVGRLVHDDHRRCAEAGLEIAKTVEIHRRIDDLMRWNQRHRRTARNDGEEIVPAAAYSAGVALDQLAERHRHGVLDHARLVHVAGDLEELGALVLLAAERLEPARPAPEDGRHDGDRLDVVDRRRAAVEAGPRREGRLEARHALLALEAFEHRRLFAADIGAGAAVDEQVEIVAGPGGIPAEQAGVISLLDRRLE